VCLAECRSASSTASAGAATGSHSERTRHHEPGDERALNTKTFERERGPAVLDAVGHRDRPGWIRLKEALVSAFRPARIRGFASASMHFRSWFGGRRVDFPAPNSRLNMEVKHA
jgi:hypothetical protein